MADLNGITTQDYVEPLPLTAAETAVLKAFRDMDDRSQAFITKAVASQAARCPRRSRVSLRVIVGGAA